MLRSQGQLALRAAVLCVVPFLFALTGRPAGAQTNLQATFESFDGKCLDIAAQSDVDYQDPSKRAWIAQGRVRAAIRLSDRARMHDEDRTFTMAHQVYPQGAPDPGPELIVALEVNEDRIDGKKYLYTLTERALYREEISDPSNPTNLYWVPMIDICPVGGPCNKPLHLQPWEFMQDVKFWNHPTNANQGKVILLTSKRVVVIKDRVDLFEVRSSADELFDQGEGGYMNDTSDLTFNDKLVKEFWHLRLAEDGAGIKAFVTAEMDSRLISNARGAKLILACDLDQPGNFQNPTFDNDPGSGYFVTYWDPFEHAVPTPVPPPNAPSSWNDLHTVESLDAIWHPSLSTAFVYAACGQDSQVQRLDVTDWFATGGVAPTVRFQVHAAGTEPIKNVLADPTQAHRFFVLREHAFSIVLDEQNPSSPAVRSTVKEPNARKGSPHDIVHVAVAPPATSPDTVWTTGDGTVDYVCKVLDVTKLLDPGMGPVPLVDEYPMISSSDGGVYVDFGSGPGEIYIPTFGGVLRYTYDATGDEWESVPDSYQPAEEGGAGSGISRNTEHIAYGFHVGQHHLYTAPADGGFMEFEILPDRSLNENLSVKPDPTTLPPDLFSNGFPWFTQWQSTWPINTGSFYGNDVTYLRIGADEYVLTILTNFDLTEPDSQGNPFKRYTQHALLAYRWNASTQSWEHVASQAAAPIPYPGATLAQQQGQTPRLASVVAVAPGLGQDQWFAFVGHRDGFFSVDLSGLTSAPYAMALKSDFNNLSGHAKGIVANEDRLFVWVDDELRIYQWDRSTAPTAGTVAPGDLSGTGEPLGENQYTMLPTGGLVSAYPGRCFRMRFHRDPGGTNGSGHLLAACEPLLLKMAWPGPGGGGELPENTLGPAQHWASSYTEALQDCHVYDFSGVYGGGSPTKILAVKNSEAFAIVDF